MTINKYITGGLPYLSLLVVVVAVIGVCLGTHVAYGSGSYAGKLYVIEYGITDAGAVTNIMSTVLGYEVFSGDQPDWRIKDVRVTAPGISNMLMHSFRVLDEQINMSVMFSDQGIIIVSGRVPRSAKASVSQASVIGALKAVGWDGVMREANITVVPREYGGYEVYDVYIDGVRLKYPVTVGDRFISGWFPASPRIAHVIEYDPVQAIKEEASKYFDASTAKIRGPIYMPDLMDPYATRILPTYVVSSGGDTLYIQLDENGVHTVVRAQFAGSGPQLAPSPILTPYEVTPVQPENQANMAIVAVFTAVAAGGAAAVVIRRRSGIK